MRGLVAEVQTDLELVRIARALRDAGYTLVDAYSPYVVPDIEEALGLGRPKLTWVIGVISFGAAALGYLLQWWCNAWLYPLDVGGRPAHAVPAFLIITFESAILVGATAAFLLLLRSCGLPKLAHPLFRVRGFRRASIDAFFIAVDADDPRFDAVRTRAELERLGVLRVEEVAP